jgi:DMSO/TMAO reductase YedYZ molybdopterin-dependent catalytic subunit
MKQRAMIPTLGRTMSRRKLLQSSVLAGGALLVGFRNSLANQGSRSPSADQIEEPFRHGQKIATINFMEEARVPMGQAFGAELDRRMYTDLSALTPDNMVTPTKDFYIRTGASQLLGETTLSSISVAGPTGKPFLLNVADLVKRARPVGVHLMECAGNARAVHFGMISVSNWSGIPVSEIIDQLKPTATATRMLISGFDRYASQSSTSVPGASWVFALEELVSADAFLATHMNGEPLTSDHGAPVRLVIPGWYGCASIKWVNEITLVDENAPATSQMQEYAARTLQKGVPQLAREYEPATIDQAAMPVRVEKWIVNAKIRYRVVGILWGGSQPVRGLEIRFNPDEDYVSVDHIEQPANDPWSFWTHAWTPQRADTYIIRLRVKEPRVRARRLDAGYYVRTVEITET